VRKGIGASCTWRSEERLTIRLECMRPLLLRGLASRYRARGASDHRYRSSLAPRGDRAAVAARICAPRFIQRGSWIFRAVPIVGLTYVAHGGD
jgi:hypothetical protein